MIHTVAGLRKAQLAGSSAVALALVLLGPCAAQAQAGPSEVDEIVVTGQRAAERAAIETKRDSLGQVDAINANDVGKLPDQNVAEAVRRVAGVAVANDQGEGRYLIIRGVAPDLANVTINNQTAPAPEPDSRQVKLDDIPSSMIGSVKVIKTLTPDLDANAIAGQADIDTLNAYDKGRTFASARAAVGYFDLNNRHPVEGDITAGGIFGSDRQFGVVVSGNYSRRPIESQNVQGPEAWPDVNGFRVPEDFEIRDYNLIRKRKGLVANLDYRPNDDVSVYLRTLYSKFEDKEVRDQFRVEIPADDPDQFFNQTATSGSFVDTRTRRALRDREEDDDTLTLNLGGHFNLGVGKLDLEGAYSRANKRDPRRNQFNFRSGSHVTADYNTSDVLFTVTPDATAFDPNEFDLHDIAIESRKARENLYQARADYALPLEALGEEGYLKFGAKWIDRRKVNDEESVSYDFDGDLTLAQAQRGSRTSIYGGRYPFGPLVDVNALYSYFAAHGDEFEVDDEATLADSLAGDYHLSEKIYAGYVMANLKVGDLTLIPGVRVERTVGDYRGKSITPNSTLDQGFDQIVKKSYTDVFPGINVRYDITPEVVVRAAVTTAIGRPDYAQLAPFVSVNVSDEEVSLGNPNLKPLTSVNFDASLEYYLPNHRGLLSAAVFHKKIEHPIYTSSDHIADGVFAGIQLQDALVEQPFNADDAKVTGLELNAQLELSFLPSPLDGFGVNMNATFIDSKVSGVPGHPDDTPLFGQSDRVASAQIYYEKYGFSARLAYSYRSSYLLTAGAAPATDAYVAAHGQLDARVAYAVTKGASVFIEGTNLNNEPYRVLVGGNKRTLAENEIYGWSARAGVQLDF